MAGVRVDPQFGPLVVCGMGGVLVEVLRDTACTLAPVGKAEALDMLRSLKGHRLLKGFRGGNTLALDAWAEAIARLAELDVNPIVVTADRAVAVDALTVTACAGGKR